jgi:hypothetical protein
MPNLDLNDLKSKLFSNLFADKGLHQKSGSNVSWTLVPFSFLS